MLKSFDAYARRSLALQPSSASLGLNSSSLDLDVLAAGRQVRRTFWPGRVS
jgi:hypothetical protein